MTEQHTPTPAGEDLLGLRAENDRLRGELTRIRRELEAARAALSWIDSMEALDALAELDDLDEAEPTTGRLPAPTPAVRARGRVRDGGRA